MYLQELGGLSMLLRNCDRSYVGSGSSAAARALGKIESCPCHAQLPLIRLPEKKKKEYIETVPRPFCLAIQILRCCYGRESQGETTSSLNEEIPHGKAQNAGLILRHAFHMLP